MDREEASSLQPFESIDTARRPGDARPLDEEWDAVMERLGTQNRGDAFLAEAAPRVDQLLALDLGRNDYKRLRTEGQTWKQRREERGLAVHDLARQVGVTSLDLWFLEIGLPPVTRQRDQVASDLNAVLADS